MPYSMLFFAIDLMFISALQTISNYKETTYSSGLQKKYLELSWGIESKNILLQKLLKEKGKVDFVPSLSLETRSALT